MDGPPLTRRERTILQEIEQSLRGDAGLDRRLRTMRTTRTGRLAALARDLPHGPGTTAAALVAGAFVLLVLGATAPAAAAWTLFGAVWAALALETALGVRRLGRRLHRRG